MSEDVAITAKKISPFTPYHPLRMDSILPVGHMREYESGTSKQANYYLLPLKDMYMTIFLFVSLLTVDVLFLVQAMGHSVYGTYLAEEIYLDACVVIQTQSRLCAILPMERSLPRLRGMEVSVSGMHPVVH